MAKKTKKQAQAETPEIQSSENIPPTIVESSEGEVFAPTQETEQPAPKPVRPSKRPYIALVESHLTLGDLSKKGLLELILSTFPTVSKGGAGTFLTDLKNEKYNHFKPRAVTRREDGKLIFADKVMAEESAPVEVAAPAETTQPELPAE